MKNAKLMLIAVPIPVDDQVHRVQAIESLRNYVEKLTPESNLQLLNCPDSPFIRIEVIPINTVPID